MNWFQQLGEAAGGAADAANKWKSVFNSTAGEDKVAAKADGAFSPKMIALSLGGVLVVAIVLKLVFRK